jgi:hypothetical protein
LKRLQALSVSLLFMVAAARAQQAQPAAQQPAAAPQDAQQPPAQTPPPSGQSSSSSSSSSAPTAPSERRFSGGVTLSVIGLSLIPGRTFTNDNSVDISTQYQTSGESQRIGYGLTAQARVKGRFYLDVSAILHRIAYAETTTVSTLTQETLNGTPYTTTTTTSTQENTHGRLIDIPFLVRYYGVGKHPGSPRWFLEAGGTYRFITDIKTSSNSTDEDGNVTCCTTTPTTPKDRAAIGGTVGAGIRFTDEFGIHVTPEFRYTRWFEPIFENLSTITRSNQIEADISITF